MNKLFVSFALALFLGSVLTAIYSGGGESATYITADITSIDGTIPVANTKGFLEYGTITIGAETIRYTDRDDTSSQLEGCTRGYDDTTAVPHLEGNKVYTNGTSLVNAAAGFDIARTGASTGNINIMTFAWNIATKTVPNMITWNYPFLKEGALTYLRYVLLIFSSGFVLYICYIMLVAMGGVAQSIWNKIT